MNDHIACARKPGKTRIRRRSPRRRGNAAALVVISLPFMVGAAAMTVDVGYMYLVRQELQTSADAGALAAAWTFVDPDGNATPDVARAQAMTFATMNSTEGATRVEFVWVQDPFDTASPLVPTAPAAANAIRVVSSRASESGNPLNLFFAGIFGRANTDISASAVAGLTPAFSVDGIPAALRVPGFGPVDPDIAAANPGKDGPSEPDDGVAFRIGEQVTVFTFGKGKKSPVHLVLNIDDIPGEAHLGKVLRGEEPPVPLAVGDEIDVVGEGRCHNGLGGKLADRLDDLDPANDTVILPVVETLPDSRNARGELTGNVRIVDFIAVHLDQILEVSVPDPNDPQDSGKTIDIELLVGTVVQRAVSGAAAAATSGVVVGPSVAIPQLIR